MKKKMITALCALTLTLGTAGSCFAAETNPQTTQAYINIPATAIDFSVTEEIIFDGTAILTLQNLARMRRKSASWRLAAMICPLAHTPVQEISIRRIR